MKKVTFGTLKSLASKGLLRHRITAEHGAYGIEFFKNQPIFSTTLKDLKRFKATKNYISTTVCEDFLSKENSPFGRVPSNAQLTNCIFSVVFFFANELNKK